jgi:hypothetical protein
MSDPQDERPTTSDSKGKAAPAPDLPPVPAPPPPSLLSRSYLALGVAALGVYLAAGLLGWDVRTTEAATVPATVRTAPGGYRTFHFWHTGYHGGK